MSTIRALNAGAPGAGTTTELMPSLAKAWVNYNATNITVTASLNISSVTNVGTGNFGINYANAFVSAAFTETVAGSNRIAYVGVGSKTASASRLFTENSSFALVNEANNNFVALGDLA